jgi:hypothetical protein
MRTFCSFLPFSFVTALALGCSSPAPAARANDALIGTPHHAVALSIEIAYSNASWTDLMAIPLTALPPNIVNNILPFVPPMFEPGDRSYAYVMFVPGVDPNGTVYVLERDGVPLTSGGPTRQVLFIDGVGRILVEALGNSNTLYAWNEVNGNSVMPLE